MTLAGMRIAFRTDASLEAGSGHVMRCLTLANALRDQGAECRFVCREHQGHLAELLTARGHSYHLLPTVADKEPIVSDPLLAHASWLGCGWEQDATQTQAILAEWQPDWLVVDHYAIDACWERILRPHVGHIMAIDDLADRSHECDLLLDQNLGRQPSDYRGRVPSDCALLIGPSYALLRPEFAALRKYSLDRRQRPVLKRLLITMGGVDQFNATGRVLAALRQAPLPDDCRISVVMGAKAPWLAQVKALCATLPWPTEVLTNINNMAQLMADSDLAIGAAGGTSWERCCLGMPTLMLVIADNQQEAAHHLQAAGAAVVCMPTDDLAVKVTHWIDTFISVPEMGAAMLKNASAITDGSGISRVVSEITSILAEGTV